MAAPAFVHATARIPGDPVDSAAPMPEAPRLDLSLGAVLQEGAAAGPFALAILVAPFAPAHGGVRLPVRDADAVAALGAERLDAALAGVRATCLLDPLWAARRPRCARRLAEHHELGALGFDARRPSSADPAAGARLLEELLGRRPRWFAPARGAPCPPEAVVAAGLRDLRGAAPGRLRCPGAVRGPLLGPLAITHLPRRALLACLAPDRAGTPATLVLDACWAADLRGLPGAPSRGAGTGARLAEAVRALRGAALPSAR
jgi:hypothetical protein